MSCISAVIGRRTSASDCVQIVGKLQGRAKSYLTRKARNFSVGRWTIVCRYRIIAILSAQQAP
jgi:hypothetical protein